MKKEICVLLLGACLASPVLAQDDNPAIPYFRASGFAQLILKEHGVDDGKIEDLDVPISTLSVESDNWLDPAGEEDAKPATPLPPKDPALSSSDDDWSTDEEGQDRIDGIKGKKKKPKDGDLQGDLQYVQGKFSGFGVSEIIPTLEQPSKSTIALNPDEDLYGTSEEANAAVNDGKTTGTRSDDL